MTYVSPTHVNSGDGGNPRPSASDNGDDPFYMTQEKGRSINPNEHPYPEGVAEGKPVEPRIGKAGDGAPSNP